MSPHDLSYVKWDPIYDLVSAFVTMAELDQAMVFIIVHLLKMIYKV